MLVAILASAVLLLAPASGAWANHYDRLLAPQAKCGGSAQTSAGRPLRDQQQAMTCLHNKARRKAGRITLRSVPKLRTSARRKSYDMLRCQAMSHYPCGDDPWRRIREVGYMTGCYGVGENVSYGSGSYGSARATMSRWLHSDGHRTNILDGEFRHVGIGVAEGTYKGRSGAQLWTAHFGHRRC